MNAPASSPSLKVLKQVGSDELSESFLAEVPGFLVPMVVRVLKADVAADEATAERFLAGARALTQLRHPSLVSVHGAGRMRDGRVYALTEFVDGPSLEGPCTVEQTVKLGIPLADALHVLHQAQLHAGHITPERVLISLTQVPKLDVTLAALTTSTVPDDVRSLAEMLKRLCVEGDDKASLESTIRRALLGDSTAAALSEKLATLQLKWAASTHISNSGATIEQVTVEDPDLTGQTIATWEVVRVIGEGAMGRVYEVRHHRIGRRAALKVLKAEHAKNNDLVQRFMQEATAVNAIKNEHIVEVYDFGESVTEHGHRRVYCVMELLEGQSLAEAMATPLPVLRAVKVAFQVARALGSAHEVGVVHRDIKPENIFLHRRGDDPDFVKVLDFGVAKLLKPIGELPRSGTLAGSVIGTPEYMAPEQALGMETDLRADLYACGLVLYELLAGRQPFAADTFGKLVVEITTKPPPPLPAVNPLHEHISSALVAVVMKAMEKNPVQRYQTSQELAAALEPFLVTRPKTVPLPPVKPKPIQLDEEALAAAVAPSRGPLFAALGLVLLSGLAFGGWWLTRGATVEPTVTETVTTKTVAAPVVADAPAADTVTLTVTTEPAGATVTRADTGAVLGTTPLRWDTAPLSQPLALTLTLDGHESVERSVSLSHSVQLELAMAARADKRTEPQRKKKGPVSRNGLVEPF